MEGVGLVGEEHFAQKLFPKISTRSMSIALLT